MAGPGASGLEVLLSVLQSSKDPESTISVLSVLDELLSGGTDRRFFYMVSRGVSEALLQALVKAASTSAPDSTILLPLLHLLAKVGHRDRRIGEKAEKAEAVLLTLTLLKRSAGNARMSAACLWVLRVFCSSVSTAALLGENGGLDVLFRLISPYTTKHTHAVKAAIDAFAGLFRSMANSRQAASEGYISRLLELYEDWHCRDTPDNAHMPIRRALLRCLHFATNTHAASAALVEAGGLALLLRTTQACLSTKLLACLVEPAVQLMRKCYPRSPIPVASERSTYSFPLPARLAPGSEVVLGPPDETLDEESEDDDENDSFDYKLLRRALVRVLCREPPASQISGDGARASESGRKVAHTSLSAAPDRLWTRPALNGHQELLGRYVRLCPELQDDFQDLDSSLEMSNDEEDSLSGGHVHEGGRCGTVSHANGREGPMVSGRPAGPASPEETETPHLQVGGGLMKEPLKAVDFLRRCLWSQPEEMAGLLAMPGSSVPGHDQVGYLTATAQTKSIVGHSAPAFSDFWGHVPLLRQEPMATRTPDVQRKKVFDDVQRIVCPEDILNKVVFDLEDPSCRSPDDSDGLQFDSRFECGNLRKVIQVHRREYDLILNADANSSEHHQWFYFEVIGMQAHVDYRFNIINCEKPNSQFNYGMQPVLYSVREALEGRPSWVRIGNEICYYRNHYVSRGGSKGSPYYTLTFTVMFQHEEDVCYLAYHYPYTYTALQAHLQMLQRSVDPKRILFRQQSLCSSLAGNSCPLVTITACPTPHGGTHLHQLRNRPYVVLTARVHPGESNASWVMKGSLDFLCSDDPVAQALREAYIFKVIPMLNPDGVISGSYRCSLSGKDLNRQWEEPDALWSPTIYHAKGLLSYLSSIGRSPQVFCDYHGHSRKKNFFLLGCSTEETLRQSDSGSSVEAVKEESGYHTIPKALDCIAPAFSFNSCSYVVERSRASTARAVAWRDLGVRNSYTMESTYNGCNQGIYKGLQVGTRELEEMGAHFCRSLLSLRKNSLPHSEQHFHHASAQLTLEGDQLDHKSHNIFEDDEPPCAERIEYLDASGYLDNISDSLDSEIDQNVSSSEDEEEEEEERQQEVVGI